MTEKVVWILNHNGTDKFALAIVMVPLAAGLAYFPVGLTALGFGWVFLTLPVIEMLIGVSRWFRLGPGPRDK